MELFPVTLLPQLMHVGLDLFRMNHQLFYSFIFRWCFQGFQVGEEGCLGIDNDLSFVREPHDHVRPQATILRVFGFLFVEITVLHHAGQFSNSSQGKLSPPSSHLGGSERLDQIGGLFVELLLRGHEGLDLLRQAAVSLLSAPLHLLDVLVELMQRFSHGLHELFHLFLAQLQIPAGPFLILG